MTVFRAKDYNGPWHYVYRCPQYPRLDDDTWTRGNTPNNICADCLALEPLTEGKVVYSSDEPKEKN